VRESAAEKGEKDEILPQPLQGKSHCLEHTLVINTLDDILELARIPSLRCWWLL